MKTTENNNFETFSAEVVEKFAYQMMKQKAEIYSLISGSIVTIVLFIHWNLYETFQISIILGIITLLVVIISVGSAFSLFCLYFLSIILPKIYINKLSLIEKKNIVKKELEQHLLLCKNKIQAIPQQLQKEQNRVIQEVENYLTELYTEEKILENHLKQLKQ